MSVDATGLSQDVLGHIFSFLDSEDLCRAAQVCRGWNTTSKLEWVWQNIACSILDLSEPSQGSWKKQCQILQRLKAWKPQNVVSMGNGFHDELGPAEFRVFLEDNTVFEVTRHSLSSIFLFSVRNLTTKEKPRQFDVRQYGCAEIFQGSVHGTAWTIRDRSGKILQFDIGRGECINQFVGEAVPDGTSFALHSNALEIIASVQNRVQIWDLEQRRLVQTIAIDEGWKIWGLCSTPNFVLCLASQSRSPALFAVNRKDPSIQTRLDLEAGYSPQSFKCCGSYCAMLTAGGRDLLVYEDSSDARFRLRRTIRIQGSASDNLGTVQMYKNWACVRQDNGFYIFDVRNGRQIVSRNLDRAVVGLQVNAQALFVHRIFRDIDGVKRASTLSLSDFRERVQATSSSGACSVT